MKVLLPLVLMTAFLSFGLSGCNTVQGLGEDVESLGENIEEEAKEKKTY